MRAALPALLFLGLTLGWTPSARGKAQSELAYRVEEVFSTALRFVRVDRGCKITDKDPDAAFVMFECRVDETHVSRGAVEIFHSQTRGKDGVRLSVSLPDEGHGPELRMVELIERKLRDERGTPAAPRPAPPAAPTDGGVKP
jgi:hypothetical protein